MRSCMSLYLTQHRNYTWYKLELLNSLNGKQTSNFDYVQFLCQLEEKLIQYLILKLQSMVKWTGGGKSMMTLLGSKMVL